MTDVCHFCHLPIGQCQGHNLTFRDVRILGLPVEPNEPMLSDLIDEDEEDSEIRSLRSLSFHLNQHLAILSAIPCDTMVGADAIKEAMDEAQARLNAVDALIRDRA